MFSPSLLQTPAASRRQALALARELGCVTSDPSDETMVGCLRAAAVHTLNAAQTKVGFKVLLTRGDQSFLRV